MATMWWPRLLLKKKTKERELFKVSIGALKGTLKVCSFLHWGTRSKRRSHFCRRPKIIATEQGTRRAPSNSAPTNSWTRTGSGKLKPGVAEDCHFSIYRAPAQTPDGSVTWEWSDHQQLFGGLLTSIDLKLCQTNPTKPPTTTKLQNYCSGSRKRLPNYDGRAPSRRSRSFS